jgi:hypothetical protein
MISNTEPKVYGPEEIHDGTGFNIGIAACEQGFPGWWDMIPQAYAEILEMRKNNGFEIPEAIDKGIVEDTPS